MIDFRQHRETIYKVVEEMNRKDGDSGWKWKVYSIGKHTIRLQWSYLKYLEEQEDCFYVCCNYYSETDGLSLLSPCKEMIDGIFVVYDTDKAIENALWKIYDHANQCY